MTRDVHMVTLLVDDSLGVQTDIYQNLGISAATYDVGRSVFSGLSRSRTSFRRSLSPPSLPSRVPVVRR